MYWQQFKINICDSQMGRKSQVQPLGIADLNDTTH